MITSKIGMHEVAEKGFRALINDRDQHVKILVDTSLKHSTPNEGSGVTVPKGTRTFPRGNNL